MVKIFLFVAAVFSGSLLNIHAQDTLPKFTLKNIGNNRVIISWTHNYQLVKQISIQRSSDSLGKFTTILTVPDPMAHQNGYADTKVPNDHMYYRLFISLDKGMFFFSKTKSPEIDTIRKVDVKKVDKLVVVDSVSYPNYDEVTETKRHELFIPSIHVYTHRDGYVRVNLPEASEKKYHIKFYDQDNTFLFELKEIKETYLTLDKAAFYHSGWFRFELYEDGRLIEKHKFYLPREF